MESTAGRSGYAQDQGPEADIGDEEDDDGEEEEIPEFSPAARRFTQLEIGNWEASFKAISSEPALLKDDVNDAILLEAFEAAIRGDKKYAKACVHQSLVLMRELSPGYLERFVAHVDALMWLDQLHSSGTAGK